jgi:hypothetical protein
MLDAGAPSGRPLPWFQIFKYAVFGLLALNAGQFFLEDYAAIRPLFGGGLQWSQIIEGYAATIDTVAWLILLLMFELETSLLSDERRHNSWVKWSVNTLKAIAYGFIVYSLYGYIAKYTAMYSFELSTIENLCAQIGQQLVFMISPDDFAAINIQNCAELTRGETLFRLPETNVVADSSHLALAQNLAFVDVTNASDWVLIVLILQADVWMQLRHQLTHTMVKVMRFIKALLYSLLFGCGIYWGINGTFLDFWDASLWILAFSFIELNIFKCHETA